MRFKTRFEDNFIVDTIDPVIQAVTLCPFGENLQCHTGCMVCDEGVQCCEGGDTCTLNGRINSCSAFQGIILNAAAVDGQKSFWER